MRHRILSVALGALLSALAVSSCKDELRPGHCFTDKDCIGGQMCDSIGVCVPAADGGAVAGQGGGGQGGPQAGHGGAGGGGQGGAAGTDGPSVPGIDAAVPADALPCKRSDECPSATPACDTTSGKCVQCLSASMCPTAAAPICSAERTCSGCTMDVHCTGRADGLKACDTASGACVACTKGPDCSGATPVCDTAAHRCVECVNASQCPATGPVCGATRTCGKCAVDAQCSGRADGLKACDTASGACVPCTKNTDCGGATPFCDTSARRCVQCLDGSGCSGTTPICGPDRQCTKCGDNSQCAALGDAARRFCLGSTGACVQCLDSDACSGTTPFCSSNVCATCGGDDGKCVGLKAEPGICMDDGHCAAQAEVIYVKYTSACESSPEGGDGSLGAPYCTVNTGAKSKLSAPRNAFVLRGPLERWSLDAPSGFRTLVVGQSATVGAVNGSSVISVTSGDVAMRGFVVAGASTTDGIRVTGSATKLSLTSITVKGNGNVGILATGGASLRMNRCTVQENTGGGIKTDGASFDITNSIIVGNSAGAIVGGVTLGPAPSTGPKRFLNNTIADNRKVGVSCAPGTNHALAGTILHSNDGLDVTGDCVVTSCCSGNPLLTSTYRLMSGSPCLDQLAPAMSVPDDIDGKVRPYNGKSDCGASEWSP